MKNLITGFLLSLIAGIVINMKTASQMESIEYIKVLLVGSAIMTPLIALLIYAIKFAGIPLVKDFIDGNAFERILIIVIVVSLFYVKFIM